MTVSIVPLGKDQTLKINSVTVAAVSDLTLTRTTDEIDVTTRGSGGFHEIVAGLRSIELSFSMLAKANDATVSYLEDAFLADTPADRIVEAQLVEAGVNGNWALTQFNRTENLGEGVKYDVTLKLMSLITSSSGSGG